MSILGKLTTLFTREKAGIDSQQAEPRKFPTQSAQTSWKSGLSEDLVKYAEKNAALLTSLLDDLANPTQGPQQAKERLVESRIENLKYWAPKHPLIDEARAAVKASKNGTLEMKKFSLPTLKKIGSTQQQCPYCDTALAKFPARAAKCKKCGNTYHSKKRPIDGLKVILKESEVAALEEEWMKDYKIKESIPKVISPKWQAIIDLALATESSDDPEVEEEAHRVFLESSLNDELLDAKVKRVIPDGDKQFLEKVENRVWQLQVRSAFGRA